MSTCNSANNVADVAVQPQYPEDIEGLWTFVYFSHGRNVKRSVGFIQYGPQATPVRIQSDVTHPDHSLMKFVLGGKQFSYQGFNGIFANVIYKLGAGAFVDNMEQFIAVVAGTKKPFDDWNKIVTYEQVADAIPSVQGQGVEEWRVIGGGDNSFPTEYSVSGWFRWSGAFTAEWTSLFYLSINAKADWADGQKLGDRVLGCQAHSSNFYYSLTYKYDNMNGAGNANANKRLPFTAEKINAWHFIYQGYSKTTA